MHKNNKYFQRNFIRFKPKNIVKFKEKAIRWADENYSEFTYLENNNISYPNEPFLNILAIGVFKKNKVSNNDTFTSLFNFCNEKKDWVFGYLTYDLKNEIESLVSNNKDNIQLPPSFFYIPIIILKIEKSHVKISSLDELPEHIFNSIHHFDIKNNLMISNKRVHVKKSETKESYIENINTIKEHIIAGDVYEINYCTEFFVNKININAINLFLKLNKASPMPFAVLQKANGKYLICASPERFMKKKGHKLISQPIKGTAKRSDNKIENVAIINKLKTDEKEIAENMMIVDLVRNDLAKSSIAGTVKATELFEVYTFKYLHQMISTIESQKKKNTKFTDVLKNAFPMGSMTGAPKIMAMKLIERYEKTKRGLYSGSVGYITPEADFDFNVVIRSIIYSTSNHYMSFQVGGAITYDSIPEKEYEECLLKAKAIIEVLST